MSEGFNIEVAQALSEEKEEEPRDQEARRLEFTEIIEAVLLAAVAIMTAWSGYQAAQWDGKNALYYTTSTREHMLATRQTALSGQQLLYNTTTFNSWDAAKTAGHAQLANRYVDRFTPDYRIAFEAWLKTDPEHNPHAPQVPSAMPHYRNPAAADAKRLDTVSEATLEKGTDARHTSDEYIRGTVLMATVLFLIAIGQRFHVRRVRLSMLGLSLVLLGYTLITLWTYPRL